MFAGLGMHVMEIGAKLLNFLDPWALALVVIGAFVIAFTRSVRSGGAFAALKPMFTANPHEDGQAAMRAVRAIERIAEVKGIACADRVSSTQYFLKRAASKLSDVHDARSFALWAEEELDDRRRRHGSAIGFWHAVADAAPAMGMIGTIVGLVMMFQSMADADAIGPAMALAMLTTLYGVMLTNLIALPIARRLERLSEDELAWQRRALDHLEELARKELTVHALPSARVAAI